jgi:hypothetical protein
MLTYDSGSRKTVMSDTYVAMFLCSGWLASILVGVTIDVWRMRRRQRLMLATDAEGLGRQAAGAPAHRAAAARPPNRPAAAPPFESFDGLPHSPVG